MEIHVNGEPRKVDADTTVWQLIVDMGLADKRVAVEVNQAIVPRSEHTAYQIRAGDRIEIVTAIGGG
ncbi:MAG: sulfur carrier protein ThiS [Gammaproteobacteria bacterium]|nr:sulfur carrier protein ThiS [Gammaproteobacteria bacterium]